LSAPLEENEFRRLALHELPAVYRLSYHLSDSTQDADDFVQETYLHALKCASGFELREHGMRPWLFKILHNVINARYGQLRREAELLDSLRNGNDGKAKHAPAQVMSSPSEQIDWDSVDQRLKHAIDALPHGYKTVFLLSAVEGMRYRQIADIIEAPVGTVMSRLYRARTMLAAQLQELAAENRMHIGGKNHPHGEMNSSV
jgi:RNA polymerase sigma-70 factor (ECF subfamily)